MGSLLLEDMQIVTTIVMLKVRWDTIVYPPLTKTTKIFTKPSTTTLLVAIMKMRIYTRASMTFSGHELKDITIRIIISQELPKTLQAITLNSSKIRPVI